MPCQCCGEETGEKSVSVYFPGSGLFRSVCSECANFWVRPALEVVA